VILLLLAGCQRGEGEGIRDSPDLREALARATYPSQFVTAGEVTLTDGLYEEEAAPDAASRVRTQLGEEIAFGPIGDHPRAAAAVLRTSTGGTGTFVEVAAVPFTGSEPGSPVVAFLGDRIKVRSLDLEEGEIVLELVVHGPEDPMCCPTVETTERLAWVGDKLVKLSGAIEEY
jgi:hypothetical protein